MEIKGETRDQLWAGQPGGWIYNQRWKWNQS